jgi:hypothetical protein
MTCTAACPTTADANDRALLLIQRWPAPSGAVGELVSEIHDGHVHLWWRWGEDWGTDGTTEDWTHFLTAVWPVTRDVVDAVRCGRALDYASMFELPEKGALRDG